MVVPDCSQSVHHTQGDPRTQGRHTMTKRSPLQIVQDEHGSKPQLAKKVFELLDHPEDEDERYELEYRVQTMSNRKLLRLWNAHQVMEEQFGSKDELVDAIVDEKFSGGNDDYADKISSFTVPRLLDLARQNGLVAQSALNWRG